MSVNRTDLLLKLCQYKTQSVKVMVKVSGKYVETDVANVIYDKETDTLKIITKE